ncbi:MAG: prenyltransferase [Nitrososphaeraceae archaeon]|nr:prenyltransferase [Nitrososphaeraceae archaeon]
MLISVWLRIIRIKFLLASVIGITVGILFSFYSFQEFNLLSAILTYIGVIFLHASVDILNDYWDYKRGIDNITKRTKYSGGTGVLPEKKLTPQQVYRAGFLCMFLGLAIGIYFVIQNGIIIGIILVIAIVSIYFYSTKVVNIGMGEILVGLKGAMIVIGASYVQSGIIDGSIILLGVIIGMLSSLVLFVASFPDHDADKEKGRKTLVIILGKRKASIIFPYILGTIYVITIIGIIISDIPSYAFLVLIAIPFAIRSVYSLKDNYDNIDSTVNSISNTIMFSRVFGACLCVSYALGIYLELIR